MWGSFLLCVGVFILALYLPGYAFFRSLRVSRIFSLGCAPIYSIAMYALLPILYQKVGISCNWAVLFVPTILLALVLLLILTRGRSEVYGILPVKRSWAFFALYLIAGIAACWLILVSGLGDFDTFYNRHDNSMHLNAIRAFIDSGNWSSLGMSQYLAAPSNAIPYDTGWGFYPGGWHDTVAVALSLVGCPETVVINAFNAVITGMIYPTCMFLLMLVLCKGDRLTLATGAVVTPAFNAFPWYFFLKGPIVGNMLAFALVPAVCALFIVLCQRINKSSRPIAEFCCIAAFSFIALGLSQPNGLFTFYIFAVAFLGHQLRKALQSRFEARSISRKKIVIAAIGFVLAVIAIWFFAYKIPAFKPIVSYRYASDNGLDPINALYDTLSLGLVISDPQWLMVALALIGALVLIVRKRIWLLFPPAFFAAAYYFARVSFERRPRQWFAGFWYSDPTRVGACLTIFLTPIVSLGLAMLIRFVLQQVNHLASAAKPSSLPRSTRGILGAILLAVFCCYAYFPNYTPNIWETNEVEWTPMGTVKARIALEYDSSIEQVYSSQEREFVKKVESVIPEGALVINQPHDGSVFAYGLDGLNTYFRSASSFGYSDEADSIREGMKDFVSDPAIKKAVEDTGATYLLMLDQGVSYEDGKWITTYHESYVPMWDGLNKITDDTPGLEVVLADGDMRLYKITAVDDTEKNEG